jgi:hypothetical protein
MENNSSSDLEAMRARDKLQATIERVLVESRDLRHRLDDYNFDNFDTRRSVDLSIRHSTFSVPETSGMLHRSTRSLRDFRRPFDSVLDKTWIYSRVKDKSVDISFDSNPAGSLTGSYLSGITLDRVSAVSVIALPISWNTIPNRTWYAAKESSPECPGPHPLEASEAGGVPRYNVVIVGESASGKSALAVNVSL